MATLDIILLVALVPFLITGITKGFVAQVVAILSLVLGVWMSFRFSDLVAAWLEPRLNVSPQVLHIVAFALIVVVVILGLFLLGKALTKMLSLVMLGLVNKLLGLVFALAKGALVVGLAVMLFDTLNGKLQLVSEETLSASVLYQPLLDLANFVFPYLKGLFTHQIAE